MDVRPTLELLDRATGDVTASEPKLWFADRSIPAAPVSSRQRSTYKTMRGPRSLLLTRVGAPARRPADADQQAIELFIEGERLVIDPGTFRYSGQTPWRNPFAGIETHSAVRARSLVEAASLGRFLRQQMARATLVADVDGQADLVVSRRSEGDAILTRAIVRRADRYAVVDVCTGGDAVVRWNLTPGGIVMAGHHRLEMATDLASTIIEGSDVGILHRSSADPRSGWWSPRYGMLEGANVVQLSVGPGQTAWARFAPLGTDHISQADVRMSLEPYLGRVPVPPG
jgi:hypothetical protein